MAGGSAETLVMEARCGRNLPGETQEAREGVLKAGVLFAKFPHPLNCILECVLINIVGM